MSKIEKQIILFVIIVVMGAGYAINEYIIAPEKLLMEQKAKQKQYDNEKLNSLKSKGSEAMKLKAEVEDLKQVAASIGDVTVSDIDTPQLIYDFYTSCKKYKIKGENLTFQLDDSNTKVDTPASGATVTTNNTDAAKPKTTTDLLKLTIELTISGDKNNIEKYIRSLNTLTSRKINVKSIKLGATVATVADNPTLPQDTTATPLTPNATLSPTPKTETQSVTNQVTADIIFNQYIYSNGKAINRSSTYSFYDANIGFTNFSELFK